VAEPLTRLWWCPAWGTLNAIRYHGNENPDDPNCGVVAYYRADKVDASLDPERPEAVEAWATALRPAMVANGLDDPESNQSYHGWRCKYPESYGNGPCDCFDRLVNDLAAALLRARAEAER
jgi:hypothetical protein